MLSDKLSTNNEIRETTEFPLNDINYDDDDDDDGENIISLNKIKASVEHRDDEKSDFTLEKMQDAMHNVKSFMPEIRIQPPFQPGSSPIHLLSRFMVKLFFLIKNMLIK